MPAITFDPPPPPPNTHAVNAFNDELDESASVRSTGSSQSGGSSHQQQHMRPRAPGAAGGGNKLPKRPSAAAQLGGAKPKVCLRGV